jgi:putative glutathione S-transferase
METVIKVTEEWQRAGVHHVRTEGMVKGFDIPLEIEFADDTPRSDYFLILDDGRPVATCRFKILDPETAKIERVCVVESHRGKDVGKRLIDAAEEWLKERGVKKIVVYSRDAVVGFYEKLGYTADWDHVQQGFFKEVYTEKILADSRQETGPVCCAIDFDEFPLPGEDEPVLAADEPAGNIATSESEHEISDRGEFVRQANRFTTPFGGKEGELPVEAGRYRLLWAAICPWAHRQIIAFKLLGLDGVISVGKANPVRTANGWEFSLNAGSKDPVLGIRWLSEAYRLADPDYSGRATVPAVVDVTTGKVVNNDYFRLTNYWETAWKPFHRKGAPDLYPEELRPDIDELNDVIFHEVNNAVYKAGFAQTQAEYERAYDLLFNRLDLLEERLSSGRYLFGDFITDSDIRLYVTLARFDAAYYHVFKANRNRLIDFPNLWNYAKDLYRTPGFGDTTDFDAIKRGYEQGSHSKNPYGRLSKGPDLSGWTEPHDREKFVPGRGR